MKSSTHSKLSRQTKGSMVPILIFFLLFVIFLISGILMKRMAGHRELVVVFHIPAAVFLILCGLQIRKRNEKQYQQEIEKIRGKLAESPSN